MKRYLKSLLLLAIMLLPDFATAEQKKLATDYAAIVNPFIGTHRAKRISLMGTTFSGVSLPWGMVQFTRPAFDEPLGFVVNQLSGTGGWHMGHFPTYPLKGILNESPKRMFNGTIKISEEQASAGYYAANVQGDTRAELSATLRTGIARYTYAADEKRATIIIGCGIASSPIKIAAMTITGKNSCEGYAEGGMFCSHPAPYKIYYAAEFDCEAIESGIWKHDELHRNATFAEGENSGVYFTFDVEKGRTIHYKFAISYVSVENAKENLRAENPSWNFDAVKSAAAMAWNKELSKIEIEGATQDEQIQFYTHLYHTMLNPNVFSDVNGEYMGADFVKHKSDRTHYTNFSLWDTYRTQIQLYAVLWPDITSDIVQSLTDFAVQSGGYPRWVIANVETGTMNGDCAIPFIASAYAFGAKDFDTKKALELMKANAGIPNTKSQGVECRPGLSDYLEKGYSRGSRMLEYCIGDFALSQYAESITGNRNEGEQFRRTSANWRNIYNPETKWLCMRNSKGEWDKQDKGWTESTYTNCFWLLPHDIPALIDTIGEELAMTRLDTLFTKISGGGFKALWWSSCNEPGMHIPWIYNYLGRPDKVSDLLERVFTELYTNHPNGIPGNDDMGTLSAWYVLAASGVYPFVPGVGAMMLNTPRYSKITWHAPKGDIVFSKSSDARYTTDCKVNGKRHDSTWLDWSLVQNGGTIEHKTADTPKSWGTKQLPPSLRK
ncbi:MAG: GH92 family glycosyl hydrolase [Alistipes sp.]|nr:GH92 family glycosyl hydrolase [Alistipes sp.]